MLQRFLDLILRTEDFPQRWYCGNWAEWLGWLHICSDLLIWSAYMAIPLILTYILIQRKEVPFPKVLTLFGAFIFLCGTTHAIEALIFWYPVYYLSGGLKALTAIVSWLTVLCMVPALPKILSLEELERSVEQLSQLTKHLQQSNKELDAFTSLVSHELKEPVRTVYNSAALLLNDPNAQMDGHVKNCLEKVTRGCQLMNSRLTTLLHYAIACEQAPRKRMTNLHQLVNDVIANLQSFQQDRKVHFCIEGHLPMVYCDPDLIREALWHILGRPLVTTTHPNLKISISCKRQSPSSYRSKDQGLWEVCVENDGAHLNAIEADKTLKLFSHAGSGHLDASYTARIDLGLAKKIMETHGESLWIESAQDLTCRVHFTLNPTAEINGGNVEKRKSALY